MGEYVLVVKTDTYEVWERTDENSTSPASLIDIMDMIASSVWRSLAEEGSRHEIRD